jgi:hypothetical protein
VTAALPLGSGGDRGGQGRPCSRQRGRWWWRPGARDKGATAGWETTPWSLAPTLPGSRVAECIRGDTAVAAGGGQALHVVQRVRHAVQDQRLLLEYQPANNPTFSLQQHSNSDRRILEMYRLSEDGDASTARARRASPPKARRRRHRWQKARLKP